MKSNQEIVFPRKLYLENLVFVDGFGRSGKFMASTIVASLKRVEHLQISWLLEYIPVMHQMGHLSTDGAVSLLQTDIESTLYDTLIGRNANFRLADITGIWNAKDPRIYFERIQAEDGNAALDVLKTTPPILLYLTHDVLCHGEIFFKAFKDNLKVIHIERHPIDVVASWYKKRTVQMVESLRNQTLAIRRGDQTLPWYAAGWEDQYLQLSQIDRLIHSFKVIYNLRNTYLDDITVEQKQRICKVRFEHFISDPEPVVARICDFLGTETTIHTPGILIRERCPRHVDKNERVEKLNILKANASPEAIEVLLSISSEYEQTNE